MYSNLPFCGITTLAMTNFKLISGVWLRMAQWWRACLVCVKHWGKSPTLKKQMQTINVTVPYGHDYSSQASFYQTPLKLHTFRHPTAGHMDSTWGTWTRFYGLVREPLKVHSRDFQVVRAGVLPASVRWTLLPGPSPPEHTLKGMVESMHSLPWPLCFQIRSESSLWYLHHDWSLSPPTTPPSKASETWTPRTTC